MCGYFLLINFIINLPTATMQFQSPVIHLNRVFPFLEWKKNVTKETLRKDTIAGLIGAFSVLPQAVAFATIAGLPPQYGIYAAIVPAIIAALFGSSKPLVSGPTTAISLVVFASDANTTRDIAVV